jgi:hypothetical protein
MSSAADGTRESPASPAFNPNADLLIPLRPKQVGVARVLLQDAASVVAIFLGKIKPWMWERFKRSPVYAIDTLLVITGGGLLVGMMCWLMGHPNYATDGYRTQFKEWLFRYYERVAERAQQPKQQHDDWPPLDFVKRDR